MSEASAPHAADRRPNCTAAQRNAVAELLRVSPVADELGRRFAAAGHELHLVGGSVRDALLGRLGDDLDFAPTPTPTRRCGSSRAGPRRSGRRAAEFGTIGAPAPRAPAGDHHLPGRGVRPGQPQPDRALRHQPRRRPAAAATSPSTRWPCRCPATSSPTRTAAWPTWPPSVHPHPGHAGASRSPTTRCGCCGPRGSPPSCASRSHPEVRAAMTRDGRRPGPDHRRADPRRVHQAAVRRRPGHRPAAAGRHRPGRRSSCPS